jgi:glycosyltransferase involved in cell wall biosynthesis
MEKNGRKKLVGLFTELLFPGGIQRVSCSMAALLVKYAREHAGMDCCSLISLNDPQGIHHLTIDGISFRVQGAGRNKKRFLSSTLKASSTASFLYIGHPNLAPVGLMSKAIRPDIRYAVSAHGMEVWEPLPLPARLGLRFAEMVTVPSEFTAGKVVSAQRIVPEKVRILPWGTDLAGASGNGKPSKVPDGKILLTVARLAASERYKGVSRVILAMSSVVKQLPDTYYIVVGDGDERAELESAVKSLNLSGHVIFTGLCSDRELAQYYDSCDLFVMPSSKEGFGLVYVEAMAFGKVVVATREGATPEIVINGETGMLVDPNHPEELEKSIIHLLQNDSVRQRMGLAGRARVEAKYSGLQFEKRFRELLAKMVNHE